jgi:hypothetical protein
LEFKEENGWDEADGMRVIKEGVGSVSSTVPNVSIHVAE